MLPEDKRALRKGAIQHYRQTYGYDGWGNLTERTGRHWSLNATPASATYENATNRNSQWQYDAEGNVTQQGAKQYSFDAAGRQTRTSEGSNSTTQDFDGDGRRVKRANPGWVGYEVRSSVLGGAIVTELNAQGQMWRRYVYGNGVLLAEQIPEGQVTWKHRSPSNNSEGNSVGVGGWRSNEFDPLGTEMGMDDPYLDGGGNDGGGWGGAGMPSDLGTGCMWEGMSMSCEHLVKNTNWRGYMRTAARVTITYRSIPGVGVNWIQNTWVRSRVFGVEDESWSDGDHLQYKNFIATPDQQHGSVLITQRKVPQKSEPLQEDKCSIPPLSPITDPVAQKFETGGGNQIDLTGLNTATYAGLVCLSLVLAIGGGRLDLESAYRPPTYQLHLKEVWDRAQRLNNTKQPGCSRLRQQVQQEMGHHKISEPPAGGSGPHTQGIAFDANFTLGKGQKIGQIAKNCGLTQPSRHPGGAHHFQPLPAKPKR